MEKNKAVFKSSNGSVMLTHQLTTTDKLDVLLEEKDKQGKSDITAFHYSRVIN